MKPRSKRQKGKRFETLVANIINEVFEINDVPDILKVNRSFTSGASNLEKGDINFGIAYKYFQDVIIECKKWKNITKNQSKMKSLYYTYKKRYPDLKLWLIVAGNYETPKIVLNKNDYDFINQLNYIIFNRDENLILTEFKDFIHKYKDYIKK